MWEIHNNLQLLGFLYSLVLGMIYSVFYDLFRTIRILKHHKNLTVFFEDIFYFLLLCVATFLFLLSITNGEIRAYILFGIALGFLIFNRLFSKLFVKVFFKVLKFFFSGIRAVSKGFYLIFEKIDRLFLKIFKNSLNFFKKGLKTTKGLLYTNRK